MINMNSTQRRISSYRSRQVQVPQILGDFFPLWLCNRVLTTNLGMKTTEDRLGYNNNMLSRVYHDRRSIHRRGQKKVAVAILDNSNELSDACPLKEAPMTTA